MSSAVVRCRWPATHHGKAGKAYSTKAQRCKTQHSKTQRSMIDRSMIHRITTD
jgi:hypothetical protein